VNYYRQAGKEGAEQWGSSPGTGPAAGDASITAGKRDDAAPRIAKARFKRISVLIEERGLL